MQVTIEEAKSIFSELCELAQAGLDVVITKDGQPFIKLVACHESGAAPKPERKPGTLQGKIWISPDFDEPLELSSELPGSENKV